VTYSSADRHATIAYRHRLKALAVLEMVNSLTSLAVCVVEDEAEGTTAIFADWKAVDMLHIHVASDGSVDCVAARGDAGVDVTLHAMLDADRSDLQGTQQREQKTYYRPHLECRAGMGLDISPV
jgi:hypothetical protein